MTRSIIIAGFGGQGILFAGKVLSYIGMISGKEVSWLPSYGPEMRGGTANCSVIISDVLIGSPIITSPDVLVVMNKPSLYKFENDVNQGGLVFVDSSLVDRGAARSDIENIMIPATKLSLEVGKLSNMVMLGKLLKHVDLGITDLMDTVQQALTKCVPPSKKTLMSTNMQAIELGYEF